MSDDAMNIAADAAPTPAATVDTSSDRSAGNEASFEKTPRDAIDRAFSKLQFGDDDSGDDGNAGDERDDGRNPNGTFKAKDPNAAVAKDSAQGAETDKTKTNAGTDAGSNDAPSRFSSDAKAAWAKTPDPVRAETVRAIKELETGIANYKRDFEPYREFDKDLKARGQTFKEVFDHYTGIEALLAKDVIGGLDTICQNLGLTLRQVAAHVMGQAPDKAAEKSEETIRQLTNRIGQLEKQLGGVSDTITSQREDAMLTELAEFAAKPEHGRFEELAEDIAFFIKSGRANDLKEAYELAERLNPAAAPAPTTTAADAANQADPAQTRNKGRLSTTGAPSSGSNPVNRKQPASSREALDRAFATVGL